MNFEALAFFTGMFGSLHCVSMCGPLMLSLPFSNEGLSAAILQKILYQFGRIAMYGILGITMGLIGKGFSLVGLQQILSLATGMLLIAAGLKYFAKTGTVFNPGNSWPITKLISLLSKYLSKPYGGIIAGSLNGLLPCGLTYIALAQAINLDNPLASGSYMLFFGLGTLPLLIITALSPLFFRKFKAPAILVPSLFFVAGTFLVARGLNLDIPYVSHAIHKEYIELCN